MTIQNPVCILYVSSWYLTSRLCSPPCLKTAEKAYATQTLLVGSTLSCQGLCVHLKKEGFLEKVHVPLSTANSAKFQRDTPGKAVFTRSKLKVQEWVDHCRYFILSSLFSWWYCSPWCVLFVFLTMVVAVFKWEDNQYSIWFVLSSFFCPNCETLDLEDNDGHWFKMSLYFCFNYGSVMVHF